MLRLRRLAEAACALALVLSPPLARAASFPPRLRFRSLVAAHVTVHYHQGLQGMAEQAAALAEQILSAHEARYGVRVPRVTIVLSDVADDPNGFATPFPFPLVSVRAAAPSGSDDFGNHDGWLRLVLTHELAHVVHLEEARGLLGFGRKLLGRAPYLFPNSLTPTWMIEGLATREETRGTAFGRGRNPDSRMVLRMAALEGAFPGEDKPVSGLDQWPAGQAEYLFGESFLGALEARFGERTLPALARDRARWLMPFLEDLSARRVTGHSFHALWQEWAKASLAGSQAQAGEIRARGLSESRALTSRGVRQTSPRFSPDGKWIAYTSGTLDRFRAIRVVRADGSGDRKLADRNGGTTLAWTPDGRALVYDEPEFHRTFELRSDLRRLDLATGKVRGLTRGARARDPDVSPDGRAVVFVRRFEDHSELYEMGLDQAGPRALTRSAPGTEWSGPRFSSDGTQVAAARLLPGGFLDIVLVERATGEITELTHDRAKDVEPAWTPDGSHLVFRSDRDGISNLYALRLADRALLRVTSVLGGAFAPDVSPDGALLAFAGYGARGYDVQAMALELARAVPAEPFADPYPASPALPPPVEAEADRPYRPLPALLPRFWTPWLQSTSGEWQYGAATAGLDPLLRHVYGLVGRYGSHSGRVSAEGYYQYDRLWPTLVLAAKDIAEPQGDSVVGTRQVSLGAAVPVRRTLRSSQSLGLAWRRRRETVVSGPQAGQLDLAGLQASWTLQSAKRYPYSISPVDGARLNVAFLKEAKALGSEVSLGELTADARAYLRLPAALGVLALRAGGGTTFGEPQFKRAFALGGFPGGELFDVVRSNPGLLRGYADGAFTGRSFANANLEWRFPLAHPQRGWRTAPVFLRHVHATVFLDAGHAWSDRFRARDLKTAAGVALGSDLNFAHALPMTFTAGLARGFAAKGETRAYFRLGLAF